MGVAYYDPETGDYLATINLTPGGPGDPAYFGYIEGVGIMPGPTVYLEGTRNNSGPDTSLSESVSYHMDEYLAQRVNAPMTLEDYHSSITGPKSRLFNGTWVWYRQHSRRLGAPVRSSPARTNSSRRQQAQDHVVHRDCPSGFYWSYKEKKCLKSKYR